MSLSCASRTRTRPVSHSVVELLWRLACGGPPAKGHSCRGRSSHLFHTRDFTPDTAAAEAVVKSPLRVRTVTSLVSDGAHWWRCDVMPVLHINVAVPEQGSVSSTARAGGSRASRG